MSYEKYVLNTILKALDETTSVVANTVEISTDEVDEIEDELQLGCLMHKVCNQYLLGTLYNR